MATCNDSRVARTVRDSANHPRIRRSLRVPRKPARDPSTSKPRFHGFDRQDSLAEIARRLEVIGAMAVTAEVALSESGIVNRTPTSPNACDTG